VSGVTDHLGLDDVPYVVTALESLTSTIAELWLSPEAESIEYLPGQYVLLEDAEHRLVPRSYSLANAPRPDAALSMLITRVPAGQISTWVHDRLAVGARVSLSGPYGTFVSDPTWSGPLLFLAAGSGFAPIRSLVEAELATASRRRVTVVFSARTEADVLDRERFRDLAAAHSRLRFIRTLTRAPGPAPRGRIPGLLSELCGDLAGHHVFIAGSSGFVHGCAAAANAAGAAHVHTEVFFLEPADRQTARPTAPR
jgi:CDP-4-dehydro-6-deoxyglucose reductase